MSLLTTLIAVGVDSSLLRDVTNERLKDVERRHPRLGNAAEFLSAAFNEELPSLPRMMCALESAYLCCVEIVEPSKLLLETASHPSPSIADVAATTLGLSHEEKRTLRELTEWASSYSPFMPLVGIENTCVLGRDVVPGTIRYLA